MGARYMASNSIGCTRLRICPLVGFLDDLVSHGTLDQYMQLLIDSFNFQWLSPRPYVPDPLLSVGWDGQLFDCDFNQMLELELGPGSPTRIHDIDANDALRIVGRAADRRWPALLRVHGRSGVKLPRGDSRR